MACDDVLKTRLQVGSPELVLNRRKMLIKEAISFEKGTIEHPHKELITKLPNGLEVYFLKPGKEAVRENKPNIYDMTPVIGNTNNLYTFNDVWNYLLKLSEIDKDIFIATLALIYRNAYLLDHVETNGKIRYQPNPIILQCIDKMESKTKGIIPIGIFGMLHFLNLLGWNEDVKYHTINGRPNFDNNFRVGRINTLLTCIRVPYQTYFFVNHVQENYLKGSSIDFNLILNQMQQFAQSRGTCTPSQAQIVEWLTPYII